MVKGNRNLRTVYQKLPNVAIIFIFFKCRCCLVFLKHGVKELCVRDNELRRNSSWQCKYQQFIYA